MEEVFNKIGKRMPYKVPEGFFTAMKTEIRQAALSGAKGAEVGNLSGAKGAGVPGGVAAGVLSGVKSAGVPGGDTAGVLSGAESGLDLRPAAGRRKTAFFWSLGAITAVAASLTLILVITSPARQYREIDRTFTQLDEEDQSYMMDVYENDVFLAMFADR